MSDKRYAESMAPRRPRVGNRGQYEKDQELAANLLATGYSIEEAAYIAGVRCSEIRELVFRQNLQAVNICAQRSNDYRQRA